MDLLTQEDLEQLAAPDPAAVHVSMFIPTQRMGLGIDADRIRWKNAMAAAEDLLRARGLRPEDIDELLAPAEALHRDESAWKYMSDGLAMFLRPGWQRAFRSPVRLPELTTVGERFVIGPLLPILTGDEHFLLLAVSQSRVRLLEGTRHRVEEIDLPDVPRSLQDVMAPPDPQADTRAYPTSRGGRAGTAIFGLGAADQDFKQQEVERFLRQVANGLDEYLAGEHLPMVLVGLDQLLAIYRDVTRYPHVMDEWVRRNPDDLSAEELHELAWPVVAQRVDADRQRVVERFQSLHGTGLASTNPVRIEEAAAQGRVETLLLTATPSCWERVATRSPIAVQLGADPAFASCERLDRIVVDTLTRRGDIYAFAESNVPGGEELAAVFRY